MKSLRMAVLAAAALIGSAGFEQLAAQTPQPPSDIPAACVAPWNDLVDAQSYIEPLSMALRQCLGARMTNQTPPAFCSNPFASDAERRDYLAAERQIPRIRTIYDTYATLAADGTNCPLPQFGGPPQRCPNPPCPR